MRLFLLFIIMTLLCSSQTINEQLKELEHAPPKQRVELMNHIKEQLILMNQEQRVQTINKLRAKLQPHTYRETHQRVPMQIRNNTIHLQQTNIEHQESQRHIIDIKHHQTTNYSSSHQEQSRPNQPTIQTHTEQPRPTQPTIQTHTEQPRPNQPTIQTHTEQPRPTQPTIQTHTEQPRPTQPTVQTHTEQPRPTQPTIQTHTEQPRPTQPTIQTHTEQPRPTQPTVQTHTEEPRTNQPTIQTHTEQPRPTQPTIQTHTEEPRPTQPTIETNNRGELRDSYSNSQSGRGGR